MGDVKLNFSISPESPKLLPSSLWASMPQRIPPEFYISLAAVQESPTRIYNSNYIITPTFVFLWPAKPQPSNCSLNKFYPSNPNGCITGQTSPFQWCSRNLCQLSLWPNPLRLILVCVLFVPCLYIVLPDGRLQHTEEEKTGVINEHGFAHVAPVTRKTRQGIRPTCWFLSGKPKAARRQNSQRYGRAGLKAGRKLEPYCREGLK